MTRREASLPGTVMATTSARSSRVKANSSTACAPPRWRNRSPAWRGAGASRPRRQARRARRNAGHVHADEAGERHHARQVQRPYAPTALSDRVATAARLGLGQLGREQAGEVAAHLGVGIQCGPWCEVARLPLAQHAAPGVQFDGRRERWQNQHRAAFSWRGRRRSHAPRPATATRRRTTCGGRARGAARSSDSWRGRAACRGAGSVPSRRPARR
jgi:hypothetical protein